MAVRKLKPVTPGQRHKVIGNDPSIVNQTGITPGVDVNSAYPTATQSSLGLTVRFH